MLVKICGITRLADAQCAIEHGADALGFIFDRESPRYIAPARAAEIVAALPSRVSTVGVFVDEPIERLRGIVAEIGLTTVQLHGAEDAGYASGLTWPVWRSVTVDTVEGAFTTWPRATTFLMDAKDPVRRGGTGLRV